MTTTRDYERVVCPNCGAGPGESCISRQTGKSLEAYNEKRKRGHKANYAHTERMRNYERVHCKPLVHTAWPVGRSPE